MNFLFTCIFLSCISIIRSEDTNPSAAAAAAVTTTTASTSTSTAKNKTTPEDVRVIDETIAKYGLPQDFQKLGLPGTELLADKKKFSLNNTFTGNDRNYTIKIRTITRTFSYNARYEEGGVKEIDGEEITVVKGQFAEHFERESGGYYIRTIGYTLNENGYRTFLIDLVKATANIRTRISSTVLASLVGGNLG